MNLEDAMRASAARDARLIAEICEHLRDARRLARKSSFFCAGERSGMAAQAISDLADRELRVRARRAHRRVMASCIRCEVRRFFS